MQSNPTRINSVLTIDEWKDFDSQLFDGNPGLEKVRQIARVQVLPPVSFLCVTIVKTLASVPVGTLLHTGLGTTPPNLFLALYGAPGAGKDLVMNTVEADVTHTWNNNPYPLISQPIGSGEGMAKAFLTDGRPSDRGVLFRESEVGSMQALTARKGATTRQTLMKIFNGDPLGATNSKEQTLVPTKGYVSCFMVGVQPDMAHLLTDNHCDDGLIHRFIWTELIDPLMPEEDELGHVDTTIEISFPQKIVDDGITFPPRICAEAREARRRRVATNIAGDGQGHLQVMRLRIAAGIAILNECMAVSEDHWRRAGVLMDYSEKVRNGAIAHMEKNRAREYDDEARRREGIDEARYKERCTTVYNKFIAFMEDEYDQRTMNEFASGLNGNQRRLFKELRVQWEETDVIRVHRDGNQELPEQGSNFPGTPPNMM